MIQYIKKIIIPYIKSTWEALEGDALALIINDIKGKVNSRVTDLLETNTTNRLQPMDISVNKPAKNNLKRFLESWYSQ